ncbi:uncharacterized protein [Nicotiana sylvestris]|uniref:uncharacterized protein n=1 Tax=Nicotiana sylvestris TaxID=4096 RepID=UPI00388CCFAC
MKNRQEPPKPPSPKRTVNVISGGEDINGMSYTAANKTSKITITQGKQMWHVLEEGNITFNDADTDGVLIPHNDALMQAEDGVIPKAHTLSGFDNSSVVTKGEVTLTTFAEGDIKDTKFQVVDMEMAYNMILRRPWIHEMDVVPSTLHQAIKFPSPWGICQIRGDQHTSRAINSVADTSTRSGGYNQIKMDPVDEEKTPFITDMGTYCYKVMPFGLKNAGKFLGFLVSNHGIEVNPAQIKPLKKSLTYFQTKKKFKD